MAKRINWSDMDNTGWLTGEGANARSVCLVSDAQIEQAKQRKRRKKRRK